MLLYCKYFFLRMLHTCVLCVINATPMDFEFLQKPTHRADQTSLLGNRYTSGRYKCLKFCPHLKTGILLKESITKTCLYNFDPLKPHFYIVKLGLTGVYINFLISAQ